MQIPGQKIALSSTMEPKSIMLRLENVETDGIFIKAEFYFIGIDKKGFVEYDIDKGEITRAAYGEKIHSLTLYMDLDISKCYLK